jgi:hypothetical protein
MAVHRLSTLDASGGAAGCSVTHTDAPPWALEFENEALGRATFAGPDLFECLCELRQWLAANGFQILCNGACIDTWASSMSRGMGGARKIYVTRMGQPTTRLDLVPIFGEAITGRLATVEEQAAYHKQWLESLRSAKFKWV